MQSPKIENNPLVSIIVITYNSAKYVLETLESAKAQTYQNIELIVSDDCSTDNTVEICREWIEKNKDRFVRAELVTVSENTGIPANCNRGVKASQGEWVKLIAGDDLLSENCVKNYIEYIIENENIPKFIFSNIQPINSKSNLINEDLISEINNWGKEFGLLNVNEQYAMLLESNKVWASTWFFTKDLYTEVNGFDERYKCYEDRPFMLKVLKKGIKIFHMNSLGSYYRIHDNSVQISNNKILDCFEESKLNFFINELHEDLDPRVFKRLQRNLLLKKNLRFLFNNRKNIISTLLIHIFYRLKII